MAEDDVKKCCCDEQTGVTITSEDVSATSYPFSNPFVSPWMLTAQGDWGLGYGNRLSWGGSGLESKSKRTKLQKRKARISKASRKANRRRK